MEKLTITGILPVGVLHGGILCKAIALREATLRDTLKVANPPDNDPGYYPKLACIAECLTIEGVPTEAITHDFLLDLDEEDGEYLLALKGDLVAKKKEQVQIAATLTP